jgi:hypothetical protein
MRSTLAIRQAMGTALLLGACASNSTEVVNAWKDPTVAPRRFNKVLAVFISKDAGLRRAAEDELARKLGNAVPAYTVVPDSLLLDRDKAKAWVKQAGFDGAVVMRPVRVDQETTYVPGQAYVVPARYGSMWGYWGTGWGHANEPGYVEQDQIVSVEANVYSVADDTLVWASRTKTYNPDSVRKLVHEIVDVTVAEMKRQKVFASR